MRVERRLRFARRIDLCELVVWTLADQAARELESQLRKLPWLARCLVGIQRTATHAIEARRREIERWDSLLAQPTSMPERDVRGWFDRRSAYSGSS